MLPVVLGAAAAIGKAVSGVIHFFEGSEKADAEKAKVREQAADAQRELKGSADNASYQYSTFAAAGSSVYTTLESTYKTASNRIETRKNEAIDNLDKANSLGHFLADVVLPGAVAALSFDLDKQKAEDAKKTKNPLENVGLPSGDVLKKKSGQIVESINGVSPTQASISGIKDNAAIDAAKALNADAKFIVNRTSNTPSERAILQNSGLPSGVNYNTAQEFQYSLASDAF